MRRRRLVVLAWMLGACGGRASQNDDPGPVEPGPNGVPTLLFADVVAGNDHYCGLTRDETGAPPP